MKIYYLGPKNTFSYIAATDLFDIEKNNFISTKDFYEVYQRVSENADSYGIVPIENSITSNVHESVDSLFTTSLKIIGEAYLPIKLYLVGSEDASLDTIETVYSHKKALEQCRNYLADNGFRSEMVASTAKAAHQAAVINLPTHAAITSGAAIQSENLTIIDEDIGDIKNNYTRFIVLSQVDIPITEGTATKCSVIFKIKHEPGALVSLLRTLEQNGSNLTKIESRPIPGTDWEYIFWVDFESDTIDAAKNSIERASLEYRVLGTYPKGVR